MKNEELKLNNTISIITKFPTKKQIAEFLDHNNRIEGEHEVEQLEDAMTAWEYLENQDDITIQGILKTHKILMLRCPLQPNERGYFREAPVTISGRLGVDHNKISKAMNQWVLNVNDLVQNGQNEHLDCLERIIKIHHVAYEKIHPFIDGNGRTGRMFMNWERIKLGLPIVIIHEGKEQESYYHWFKEN